MTSLQRDALVGRYDELQERAKLDRHAPDATIAPYAFAGLTVATGNHVEVGGYRELTPIESATARSLFRTATTLIARRLLREHPELQAEAMTHEFVRDHLGRGPLGRLPRSAVATVALRVLVNRPQYLAEIRDRGLLGWDDGDAAASMGIVYGWQRPIAGKKPPNIMDVTDLESPLAVLTAAREATPDNDLVRLAEARYRLAWADSLPTPSVDVLRTYAADATNGLELVALAGLFDAGLRFRDQDIATDALERLRTVDDHATPIGLPDVWLAVTGGDGDVATVNTLIEDHALATPLDEAETVQVFNAINAASESPRSIEGIEPRALPLGLAERYLV